MYCIRKKTQHSTGVACSYSRWRTWWSAATRGHRKGHWVQCSACQSFQATSCGHWFFLPLSLLSTEILWRFKDASAVHGKIALFFATQMYDLKYCCIFLFFYPQSPLAQRDISEGFTPLWSENSISFPRELVQFRKFCLLCVLRCSTFYIMGITNHQQRFLVLWDPESSVNTQRTAVSRLRSFIISSKSAVEKIQIWCYSVWWCYPWNSQNVLHLTSLTHATQSELGHVEKKVWRLQTVWWIIAMIKVCIIKH